MTVRGSELAGCAVAYALVASGCGSPLLSESAYDSPLLSLHGFVDPLPADAVALHIGIVSVDPEQLRDDVPAPAQTVREDLSEERFQLSFFAPPPRQVIRRLTDPATGAPLASFAIGELVVVDDVDGNGGFQVSAIESGSAILPPDRYRGGQARFVVSFIEQPLVNPTDGLPELQGMLTASVGYHLVVIECATAGAPYTHVTEPEPVDIEMTILDVGSSHLPFIRSCLRTHPIEPGPPPLP